MNAIIYHFLQWTWGLPLNIIGALIALFCRKEKHFRYHLARVSYWNRRGSMAIGRYIFLEKGLGEEEDRILYHEYGHTMQSILLGPLFLPVIAAPSLVWANSLRMEQYRRKKNTSYYSFYPERWADYAGLKAIQKETLKNLRRERKKL